MLADFLPRRFPDRFSHTGSLIHNHATNQTLDLAEPGRNPLEIASLLVQVGSPAVGNPISSNPVGHQHLTPGAHRLAGSKFLSADVPGCYLQTSAS